MSWPVVKLGEVAEFIRGVTFKPDDVVPLGSENSIACLRTKNVQYDLDLSDVWALPERFVKSSEKLTQEGDLVISTANSWNLVGKASWVPDLPWPTTVGGFVSLLRGFPGKIVPRYLYHWIVMPHTQAALRKCARQTTNISNLSIPQAQEIEIPLPPLAEQKRIAAILDQAARLTRLRAEALARLDTLGQAIFREMFGDGAGNASESGASPLSDLADIASGITKGRKLNGEATRPVPYMAVSNVQDQHLNLSAVKEIEATEGEIARYRLLAGDLLLTEGGDPDKLGRGCLWNDEVEESIHQNHVFRVRITNARVRPIFLQWFVGSPISKRYFFKSAKQTTGIASINKTQLGALPVFVPSMGDQIRLETRLSSLEAAKRCAQSSAAQAQTLFASLQHRAFRGEL